MHNLVKTIVCFTSISNCNFAASLPTKERNVVQAHKKLSELLKRQNWFAKFHY